MHLTATQASFLREIEGLEKQVKESEKFQAKVMMCAHILWKHLCVDKKVCVVFH